MGILDDLQNTRQENKRKLGEFLSGVGKGALSTVRGISSLGEKGLAGVSELGARVFGAEEAAETFKEQRQEPAAGELITEEMTEARTPIEKAGKLTEQVGEFFIPGGQIYRAGKGVQAGIKGIQQLPRAVRAIGGLTGRAGVEAAGAAGMTALQRGDIDKESGEAAIYGAIFPFGGAGLKGIGDASGKVLQFFTRRLSGVPTESMEMALRNPEKIRQVMRRYANDIPGGLDDLRESLSKAMSDYRVMLNENYGRALGSIDEGKFAGKLSLDDVKNTFQDTLNKFGGVSVEKGVVDTSKSVLRNFDNQLQDMYDLIYTWDDITPTGLNRLRQVIDSSYTQNLTAASVDKGARKFNALVGEVQDNLRNYVGKNVPEIKTANAEFSKNVDVLKRLENEIGIGRNVKESTIESKLRRTMTESGDFYRNLIRDLGEKTGNDFLADIAGLTFARLQPTGMSAILTSLTGIGGAGAVAMGGGLPALAGMASTFAMASPRVVGEVLTTSGKVLNKEGTQLVRSLYQQSGLSFNRFFNEFVDILKESPVGEGVEWTQDNIDALKDRMYNSIQQETLDEARQRLQGGPGMTGLPEDQHKTAVESMQTALPSETLEEIRNRMNRSETVLQ